MARPRKDIEMALAIAAKDLLENNASVVDVGAILGTIDNKSDKWLRDLRKECSDIDEFIRFATQRADIALVTAAMKEAVGYEYTEEDITYKSVPDGHDTAGKPKFKLIETGKKLKKKKHRGNDALLRFILKNRLTEYFQDVKKVEINKKSVEIIENAEEEIKNFGKQIIAKFEDKPSLPETE